MSGALRTEGDGPVVRCRSCAADAVGPCATCRAPVCGDCCVLTDGGVTTFAICLTCDRRGGRSLGASWSGLLVWLGGVVLLLGAVVGLLLWLA